MAGGGRPGCKAPMVCMALLMARRSWINLCFPLAFFSITKIGLFHGLWKAPHVQLLFVVVSKYEPVVIFVPKVATDQPI
jgi:hypothetical protein